MMRLKIWISYLLLFFLLFSFSSLRAQEYKYEIGGMAGVSFYMGDANMTKLYQSPGPAGGVVFRINKDFRWSMKSNLIFGHLSGDTKHTSDAFPFGRQSSFSRTFYELGSQIEFNFFNYSDKYTYLNTKRLTPYVFAGLGITYASGKKTFFDANIPFGLGLKYRLRDRLNLGFEFSFRKLFSDNLDVTKKDNGFNLNDPQGIKSSALKNKDWYSLTLLSLTWNFGIRCNPCYNE